MKIRCIANTGAALPKPYLDPDVFLTQETEFQLLIGKEYIVYAFYEWQGTIWYYICDERYTYYPIHNPAPLFEVVDNRLSKSWRFKLHPNGLLEMAFEQWLSDPYFYDKLTDQKEEEVLIFEQVKELMDVEALSPEPTQTAVDESLEVAPQGANTYATVGDRA
jgi:hypothetical protein